MMLVKKKKASNADIVSYRMKHWARLTTSRLRSLPDFIIIGAAKSGTTSLYNYLVQHPQVMPCFRKEVHFFDHKFPKGLNWYKSFFPLKSAKQDNGMNILSGESSPYYMFHPLAAERISKILPEAKFFAVLRNPIDRAVSHYNHRVRAGVEHLSIEEAFAREQERIAGEEELLASGKKNFSFDHYYHSYVTRGIYANQLERWFRFIERDRLLIFKSEELFSEPQPAYDKALKHLGLPPVDSVKFEVFNSGSASNYDTLSPALRNQLIEFYRPHNLRLSKLLGMNFNWDH